MKKTLLLVRHAKAEDQSKMFKDFDRELLGRGIMDAARLGRYLLLEDTQVDLIKTSSAARTYQTAKIMAEQLRYEVEAIEQVEKLYSGGPQAYLGAVNATPDQVNTLLLCGHNPDISYFAEYLTGGDVGSMEKCSMAVIVFENFTWAEVSKKSGIMQKYVTRHSLKEGE
ncbi:MAG: histidine phosphatase family protein [Bacteroidetes bacterium]|nr:histidine phosphatase family protein [Bacteroidota bacterium]